MGSQERPELEVVRNDMKRLGQASALNHHAWMRKIAGDSTDPDLPGAPLGISPEWANRLMMTESLGIYDECIRPILLLDY